MATYERVYNGTDGMTSDIFAYRAVAGPPQMGGYDTKPTNMFDGPYMNGGPFKEYGEFALMKLVI